MDYDEDTPPDLRSLGAGLYGSELLQDILFINLREFLEYRGIPFTEEYKATTFGALSKHADSQGFTLVMLKEEGVAPSLIKQHGEEK